MDNKQNRQFYWEVKDFMNKNPNLNPIKESKSSVKDAVQNVLDKNVQYKQTQFNPNTNTVSAVSQEIKSISESEKGYNHGCKALTHNKDVNHFSLRKQNNLNESVATALGRVAANPSARNLGRATQTIASATPDSLKLAGGVGVHMVSGEQVSDVTRKLAKDFGASELDTEIADTLATAATVPIGVPLAAAVGAGAALGKAIDYGVESSGLGDVQRNVMTRTAISMNPELAKGLKTSEQATKAGSEIKQQAQIARMSELGKSATGKEDLEKFAQNMKDPAFRAQYQASASKALEGSDSFLTKAGIGALDAADWIGSKVSNLFGFNPRQEIGRPDEVTDTRVLAAQKQPENLKVAQSSSLGTPSSTTSSNKSTVQTTTTPPIRVAKKDEWKLQSREYKAS
jgi:hypothetical protein